MWKPELLRTVMLFGDYCLVGCGVVSNEGGDANDSTITNSMFNDKEEDVNGK